MTAAWTHLPNAKHIDWVLDSLRTSPNTWGAAWGAAWAATRAATRGAPSVRVAARDAAWAAVRVAARDAAWVAARDAAWDATRDATRDAAWGAAWDACISLIAWDDGAEVLLMPHDALKVLVACGDHRASLLMPACRVREELLSLKENTP